MKVEVVCDPDCPSVPEARTQLLRAFAEVYRQKLPELKIGSSVGCASGADLASPRSMIFALSRDVGVH
jgi:hypothetical protein